VAAIPLDEHQLAQLLFIGSMLGSMFGIAVWQILEAIVTYLWYEFSTSRTGRRLLSRRRHA
jgi:hypothetical protein